MASAEIDVKYVAHLARSRSRPTRKKSSAPNSGSILGYIEKLRELDVTNVEPTAHAVPMVNVTRADEIRPSLSARRRAPQRAAPGRRPVHRAENRGMNFIYHERRKDTKVGKPALRSLRPFA